MVQRLTVSFGSTWIYNFLHCSQNAWFESLHMNPDGSRCQHWSLYGGWEREMWLCWRFGQDWLVFRSHSISSGWPLYPAAAGRSGSWLGRGQYGPAASTPPYFGPSRRWREEWPTKNGGKLENEDSRRAMLFIAKTPPSCLSPLIKYHKNLIKFLNHLFPAVPGAIFLLLGFH